MHGFKLCSENFEQFLLLFQKSFDTFVDLVHNNVKHHFWNGRRIFKNAGIVSADLSLVNMIRFGLLSINLLPENSHQGIVIITDGNIKYVIHTLV